MSEQKKPSIPASVQDISDLTYKAGSIESVNGTAGTIGGIKDVYTEARAKTAIDPEQEKLVDEFRQDFVAGTAHGVGRILTDALKTNPGLETASGHFPMTAAVSTNHTVAKSKTFEYGPKEERKSVEKKGVVSSGVEFRATNNAGALRQVRLDVERMVAEAIAQG